MCVDESVEQRGIVVHQNTSFLRISVCLLLLLMPGGEGGIHTLWGMDWWGMRVGRREGGGGIGDLGSRIRNYGFNGVAYSMSSAREWDEKYLRSPPILMEGKRRGTPLPLAHTGNI